jgi:hypothetical protein
MTAAKQWCVIVAGGGVLSSVSDVSIVGLITGSMGRRGKGRMGAFVGQMCCRT